MLLTGTGGHQGDSAQGHLSANSGCCQQGALGFHSRHSLFFLFRNCKCPSNPQCKETKYCVLTRGATSRRVGSIHQGILECSKMDWSPQGQPFVVARGFLTCVLTFWEPQLLAASFPAVPTWPCRTQAHSPSHYHPSSVHSLKSLLL